MANTPWGKSDYCQEEAAGIKFYGTPSHGGYFIPKKLNNLIPDYMRQENQWYEEDCDWCIPVIHFGTRYFPSVNYKTLAQAWETFKNWHPDSYEKYTGVSLQPGESYMRDEHLFRERTKKEWVVVGALGRDDGMVVCHACLGGRDKRGQYQSTLRKFLVPSEEYNQRNHFGFIIDLDRHQEIKL